MTELKTAKDLQALYNVGGWTISPKTIQHLIERIDAAETALAAANATIERLSAPLTTAEINDWFHRDDSDLLCIYRSGVDNLNAARKAAQGEQEEK